MQTIEAYQSVDGSVHLSEKKAIEHDENCIGEAIDALLTEPVIACRGNVTRSDQYTMALYLMNNRQELAHNVAILHRYLNKEN